MTILETKILLVKKLPMSNKYLPNPLQPVERVINLGISPTQVGEEKFIKIQHDHGKAISTFSVRYFIPYNVKLESKLKKRYGLK